MIKDPHKEKEKYRIPYQECKIHSEKLNYICLDPQCHQTSLICSICREQPKHEKHPIRPLKFYMQQLQQKYSKSPLQSGLHQMLQSLQMTQYTFYQKLTQTVTAIAQQFRKLQQQVTSRFSEIKSEIQQEISKRNRFNEFYQSLKKGDVDLSNFLIQNYLPQASVGCVSNLESLNKLGEDVCQSITDVKSSIFSREQIDSSTKLSNKKKQNHNFFDLKAVIKIPTNMSFDGAVLIQNQTLGGSKSVCLIDFPIVNLSGKLIFKVLQLKKGGAFIIGVVPKKVYQSMGQLWSPAKIDNKCYVLGNDGFSKGWEKREINQFGQGSALELSYRSGELKLNQKSKSCVVKLPNDSDYYTILTLIGDTQIRITHIK